MIILISVVFLSLVISAACSLFEATLYSTRIATLESARASPAQKRGAERFLVMKRNIGVPTAAILILNTLANTAGATIAGVYATDLLGVSALPAFSIGLTLAILFFAEILPKTYAATHWKRIWPFVVMPLLIMQRVLRPLIFVTQKFTGLFAGPKVNQAVSEDEILAMIRLGATSGGLTRHELSLLDAVFDFDDITCQQVQVPRREIVWLDLEHERGDNAQVMQTSRHTRYPIASGNIDDATTFVHIKDLVGIGGAEMELIRVARPLLRVPESMSVRALLRDMQQSKRHICLVLDEYGTVSGMVTLELIVEEILGPIQDEFDDEPDKIVKIGSRTYLAEGGVTLSQLRRETHIDLYAPGSNTLSGAIVLKLGKAPVVGDIVELGDAVSTVKEVRDNRVIKAELEVAEANSPVPEDETQ